MANFRAGTFDHNLFEPLLTNATRLRYRMDVMTLDDLIIDLRSKGLRITKLRALLLKAMLDGAEPLSADALMKIVARDGFGVNKTSVYRQLLTLKNKQIIREVWLGENKKRYEIFADDHHHHLICVGCGQIEDIEAESDLCLLERKIAREKKFKVENHYLEFFGRCANCSY